FRSRPSQVKSAREPRPRPDQPIRSPPIFSNANMDSTFRQLTRGIHFNTRRFKPESIQLGLKKPSAPVDPSVIRPAANLDRWPTPQASSESDPDDGDSDSESPATARPPATLTLLGPIKASNSATVRPKSGGRLKGVAKRAILRREQVNHFRNVHRIHASGPDLPEPIDQWDRLHSDYGFHPALMAAIQSTYITPTPIQMQVIPAMLERREVLACAPTGSGKTAAFLIPLVHLLGQASSDGFRAVIIAPTRELALQIHREAVRLGQPLGLRALVLDPTNKTTQKFKPESGNRFDLIVSTPNRLVHLIQDEAIVLDQLEWLIVDESDKLFESGVKGFRDQLATIYRACEQAAIKRAMFSATLAVDVEKWCQLNLDNVLTITIGARNSATSTIQQKLVYTGTEKGKLLAFRQLIQDGIKPPVLVFVQTKDRAKELHAELAQENVHVDVIHSDRSQLQRDQAITYFRSGQVWILICTELMGRGIDFKGVNLVINYDFPPSTFSYIHRIGRTGRAGRAGQAITFFTDQDKTLLRSIATIIKESGGEVPDYMLKIKKASRQEKRKLAKHAVERESIKRESKFDRSQRIKKEAMIEASKRRKRKSNEPE
ncbi:hypothetical protein TCAL_02027, partial [Tigriopus californicus]